VSDLADYFRWQWLWRSRRRLFTVGLVVFLSGVLLLAILLGTWWWGRPVVSVGRVIAVPLILMAVGGYGVLQAAFSGGGAFGDHDHDDSRDGRRRAWRRQRRADRDATGPVPLSPTDDDSPADRTTRCPTCLEPSARSTGTRVECPKCHERFVPDGPTA
jgi:hypothetical protein